jgi:hypothetical protein
MILSLICWFGNLLVGEVLSIFDDARIVEDVEK